MAEVFIVVINFCSVILGVLLFTVAGYGQQAYVPNEVLVKFKQGQGSQKLGAVMSKMGSKIELIEAFQPTESYHFQINESNLQLKPGEDSVSQIVSELKSNPDVEYAEPNWIVNLIQDSAAEKQGPEFIQGLGGFSEDGGLTLFSSGTFIQNDAPIDAENSWANSASLVSQPNRPIVAIIDSGVDYNHGVFTSTGALWVNSAEIANDGIDNDGNGYIDDRRGWNFPGNSANNYDDNGHGTHVAGIVLGATQNIFPSPAVYSPAKIQIMSLKFLTASGSGSTSDAIKAIYYAVNNGAQVINNSWGGSSYSQSLHDALKFAYDRHLTIVTAAGNYSKNNDAVAMYPANYQVPGQISVAATDDYDSLSSFSNYGASLVHVGSPGSFILSTYPSNSSRYLSGTSMASPLVAGIAALVLREAPNLSGYQIKNLIMNSGNSVSSLAGKVASGRRVNINNSILAAIGESSTALSQPTYKAESGSGEGSREVASEANAGGCGLVKGMSDPLPPMKDRMLMMLILLTPLGFWIYLRTKNLNSSLIAEGKNRRVHDRFVMDSNIRIKVGDRELMANMKTISVGGASFQADALLEKGGVVTLQISDPSGNQQMSVQGHVVWNEENKAYGVQFMDLKDVVKNSIETMTQGLPKAN